jgi:PhoPQ-activated pathogenicity-related protein
MVKSAVKAMDAVGELGKKEGWPQPVEKFVITGASKRGWTSWLTPVADPRVVATAPMVIDTLNFRAQMNHQQETWGTFSEQIEDYTRKGLIKGMMSEETPHEAALRTMMDPWTYRERITIPKLLVNGTNDRYWVVDAAQNYFGDLEGPKYVLEIPNAGHGLEGGHDKVIASIAVLFRRAATGTPLPKVVWKWEPSSGGSALVLESDPPAQSAAFWTAKSGTNDFREAKWSNRPLDGQGGKYEAALGPAKDATDRLAGFAELKFVDRTIDPPVPFSLTTTVETYLPAETAASE